VNETYVGTKQTLLKDKAPSKRYTTKNG